MTIATLASVAELETFLDRTLMDTDPAELALEIASSAVADYLNQTLMLVEDDEAIIDGNGTELLMLPQVPVTEITKIEIDGTEIDSDYYSYNAKGMVKLKGKKFPKSLANVTVTYSHGYTNIPYAIRGVVLSIAARILDTNPAVKQESIGGYSVSYSNSSAGLLAIEQDALSAYRIIK